jgi:nitrate reductase cytochrome c-type subunit
MSHYLMIILALAVLTLLVMAWRRMLARENASIQRAQKVAQLEEERYRMEMYYRECDERRVKTAPPLVRLPAGLSPDAR